MKKTTMQLLLVTFVTAGWASSARATTYRVSSMPETDTVHFQSSAKLEFVEGLTNNIVGSLEVNPDSSVGSAKGVFRVDLRTMKTGIDLRDEHMRKRHLETDKFPYAFFEISSITNPPARLVTDSTYQLTTAGKFYIHGVWRATSVASTVRRTEGGGSEALEIRARFAIKLDDFGIPRPKALFLKLAETINVEVIFTAANNLPSIDIALPDWPEKK